MRWRDPNGEEWVTMDEVLADLPHLNQNTLRSWIRPRREGKPARVRAMRLPGQLWLAWADVLAAEAAAHRTGWRTGPRSVSTLPVVDKQQSLLHN